MLHQPIKTSALHIGHLGEPQNDAYVPHISALYKSLHRYLVHFPLTNFLRQRSQEDLAMHNVVQSLAIKAFLAHADCNIPMADILSHQPATYQLLNTGRKR